MSDSKPNTAPTPEKAIPLRPAPDGKACPKCGEDFRPDYSCGCPESWENEGGATLPADRE